MDLQLPNKYTASSVRGTSWLDPTTLHIGLTEVEVSSSYDPGVSFQHLDICGWIARYQRLPLSRFSRWTPPLPWTLMHLQRYSNRSEPPRQSFLDEFRMFLAGVFPVVALPLGGSMIAL
ncbi:hypothetical protein U1Q18_008285 [Sarracenia purpurea var. burkii]